MQLKPSIIIKSFKAVVMLQRTVPVNLQSEDSLRRSVSGPVLYCEIMAYRPDEAVELASHKITVNAYAPGFIQTPMRTFPLL